MINNYRHQKAKNIIKYFFIFIFIILQSLKYEDKEK
jgi:hypothetical protein